MGGLFGAMLGASIWRLFNLDPAFAWGVPELVREIKPEEMNVPIKNTR